jgi:serine/threonine protein kinase
MPWARRVSLLMDVARGMNYLHTRVPRVIHRDLKCGNVLVNKDWVAAVTDFGLSVTKQGRMDPADLKQAVSLPCSCSVLTFSLQG